MVNTLKKKELQKINYKKQNTKRETNQFKIRVRYNICIMCYVSAVEASKILVI